MTLDLGPTLKEALRETLRELLVELRASGDLAPVRAAEPENLDLLNVDQVVAMVPGVTAPTVRGWCRSGRLPARKIGRGYVVERAALKRFLSVVQKVSDVEPEAEAKRLLARLRGGR